MLKRINISKKDLNEIRSIKDLIDCDDIESILLGYSLILQIFPKNTKFFHTPLNSRFPDFYSIQEFNITKESNYIKILEFKELIKEILWYEMYFIDDEKSRIE